MKTLMALLATLFLVSGALAQSPADTYVFQTFGGVDTLDPAQAYDTASSGVLENIYETLVGYDGDSVTDYVPLLATEWETSDDGTVFTYSLREGVVFHSGNAFTCRDVEYTVERALVTNPADSGIWFISEAFLNTEVNAELELGEDGSDEDYADYWRRIDEAVACVDDTTVQFTLPEPDPSFFVKMMASPMAIIDSQWAIDNGHWDGTQDTWRDWVGVDLREHYLHNNTSGTGAYRLASWDDNIVVAERFDDYWGEQPAIQTVIREAVEEQSSRILAIQRGDADRITVGDRATLAQLRGVEGVTIHEDPAWVSTTVGVLFFNHNISAEGNPDIGSGQLDGSGIPADFFADVDMRKCIAYSFDQEAFIAQVLQGEGQALTMGLPPSFLGYNEDLPIYTVNPEMAEEHCRAAHGGAVWEQGFEFTATYNAGNTTRQAVLEIVKDNLEFLNPNFTMNVRSVSWPEFLALVDRGEGTMFALGWAPSYADSDYFLHPFYHSQGYYSTSTHFADEEIDRLIDEARMTFDEDEREALYREVGQRAYDLVPFLPYPSPTAFMVTRDNIEGVYLNPMYGDEFLWKDIRKN